METPTSFWKSLRVQDATLFESDLEQDYVALRRKGGLFETLVVTATEARGKQLDWNRLTERLIFCERRTAIGIEAKNPLVAGLLPWDEEWIEACIDVTRLASEVASQSSREAELHQLGKVIFARHSKKASPEDAGANDAQSKDRLQRARMNVLVSLLSNQAPKAQETIPVVFEETRDNKQIHSPEMAQPQSKDIGKQDLLSVPTTPNRSGVLACMHLKLLPGLPCSGNHPERLEQGLSTEFPEGFMTVMRDAWDWAWEFSHSSETGESSFREQANPPPFNEVCGCWQLIPWEPNAPIQPNIVSGPSLTAAMVRAWTLILQGKRVDPRVLVIGKVASPSETSPTRQLAPVDNEAVKSKVAKVREVVGMAVNSGEDAPIDRIVVFSKENESAAIAELGETLCPFVVDVQCLGS